MLPLVADTVMNPKDFEAVVFDAVRAASDDAVDRGTANLQEGEDGGGRYLELVPRNPQACRLKVYPEYPTLAMSEGTTEMFGPKEKRLHELPLLIKAVINGDYEWEYGG